MTLIDAVRKAIAKKPQAPIRFFILRLDAPREQFSQKVRAMGRAMPKIESDFEAAHPGMLELFANLPRGGSHYGTGAVLPKRERS